MMRYEVPRGGRAEKRNIRVSLMVISYSISSHGRPTIHSDIVGRCQLGISFNGQKWVLLRSKKKIT